MFSSCYEHFLYDSHSQDLHVLHFCHLTTLLKISFLKNTFWCSSNVAENSFCLIFDNMNTILISYKTKNIFSIYSVCKEPQKEPPSQRIDEMSFAWARVVKLLFSTCASRIRMKRKFEGEKEGFHLKYDRLPSTLNFRTLNFLQRMNMNCILKRETGTKLLCLLHIVRFLCGLFSSKINRT